MTHPERLSGDNVQDSGVPRGASGTSMENDKISFLILDVLQILARNRPLIVKFAGLSVVLGLFIAIFSTPQYTASAKMIREAAEGSSVFSGLSALRSFGINLGGGTSGLTEETYPDILRSREVILSVIRSKFYFSDIDSTMSLVAYYNRKPSLTGLLLDGLKKATIGLPGTILKKFRGDPAKSATDEKDYPTEEEAESIEALSNALSIGVDRNSGIMSIAVTTDNPLLSVQLVNRFVERITARIQDLYTQKAKENLEFARTRFIEVQADLQEVENNLARFTDRNQDIRSARLQTEFERLRRQVTFKSQLYSELQTQVVQSEIELERSRPVITLIEVPVPPLRKSAPKRKLIVIVSLILGVFAGGGLALVKQIINDMIRDSVREEKWNDIRAAFRLPKWLKRRTLLK